MRVAVLSAIIAAVIAGCAQFGSLVHTKSQPLAGTHSGRPIEPEALRPSDRPTRNDLVVLLPKPNGRIGGVVVKTGGGKEILLDKAYAGAQIDGPGMMQAVEYDANRMREFSFVMAALPGRPVTFLLYFLEGKDELTPDSDREVGRVFDEIAARPYPEILIIGHTDAVGNAQFNDLLSRQRAQRVRDDLVKRGIPPERIELSSRGKREPLIATSEGVAEPRNRRVEINVR
jgi:outer membrane protein OmpA-like peptidoglycan-associated protein